MEIEIMRFLEARQKTLHHIKDQSKFQKDKTRRHWENYIVGGRLKEVQRMIRKLKTFSIDKMIEKENYSLNIILDKKNKIVKGDASKQPKESKNG